ncbi:MAG: EAL domain-containing protein, partial [Pirellulales bacterium]|nr:EAL domain-containing protein [Pirellulales bacterium]
LRTGNIQGVEALIRWHDEDGQCVSPGQFIPIIEEIGLISQLGEWVLETGMRELGRLLSELPGSCHRDVYLGVNVSPRQLSDPFFLSRLDEIIARTNFDRQQLKLEMNESGDPRQGQACLATMLELHGSGVGIQIDDFGKGHSSLTCFQAYPIETVKIDRSFTASIATDHSHAVIAQAIVQLAHHLNARIIAEGVESPNQLESLRKWGCDAVQGYLFSPSLDLEGLRALLCEPSMSEGVRMLRSAARPSLAFDTSRAAGPIHLD